MSETIQEAQRLFSYNPDTGVLTRKVSRGPASEGSLAGGYDRDGYLVVRFQGRLWFGHRIIWMVMTGKEPVRQIDHIDQNPSNNRWSNLRLVTNAENGRNARMSKRNKSGQTGLYWNERDRLWQSYITVDGERITLGHFRSWELALAARKAAEGKYGFSKYHGRPGPLFLPILELET